MTEFAFSTSLSRRNGFLFCEDVQIRELQDSLSAMFSCHSSPCFVYSKQQIAENVQAYRRALDNSGLKYELGYSMKANYNPEVICLMRHFGCWAIAVSGFEVTLAIQRGICPENIILNGNGKQIWEIEIAVKNGCLINIDSIFDLQNISKVTQKLDKKVQVLIRLNPDINAEVHPYLATGLAKSKFGIEDGQLFELLNMMKDDKNIELVGLHCHLGSTIDNTYVFSECLDVMISLADKVKQLGFTSLSTLNLGGGLGINYRQHEHRTRNCDKLKESVKKDFESEIKQLINKVEAAYADKSGEIVGLISAISRLTSDYNEEKVKRLTTLLSDHKEILHDAMLLIPSLKTQNRIPTPSELIDSVQKRLAKSDYRLILEPGRSLIGNAVTFITKVIGVKRNGSQRYIVVDGSMTEVIRPALYSAYHHIELTEPSTMSSGQNVPPLVETFDVVGPVCECGDFLGKDRALSVPHEGCGVAIFDTGAYCASMASNYNMRPRPLEVMVEGNSWRVIRTPEKLEDILNSFVCES